MILCKQYFGVGVFHNLRSLDTRYMPLNLACCNTMANQSQIVPFTDPIRTCKYVFLSTVLAFPVGSLDECSLLF
jgi:hypothetical protein